MAEQILFNNTPAGREQLFISLYKKAFPAVAKYVSNKGGTFDEAKDVFQDALVIYYEKLAGNALQLQKNDQAYITGIAKHLWLKKFRGNIKLSPIDGLDGDFIEDDYSEPSTRKLMHYLETAGQKCMELLKAFYYDNQPVSVIAELFGYSGVRSATVQKFKCMEKIRETIKEKSLAYEDFVD
jgi:DNA-directed RNA polymerase specialized sigma24 family protein